MAVFEDDADVAPGLKLIRDDTPRTISGTVFEDSPLEDKLNNNERIGDGQYTSGENIVNKVKVELLCQNNEDVDTLNKVETRSNQDGSYTLSGYIPGDYLIKFTYGDKECLINPQRIIKCIQVKTINLQFIQKEITKIYTGIIIPHHVRMMRLMIMKVEDK